MFRNVLVRKQDSILPLNIPRHHDGSHLAKEVFVAIEKFGIVEKLFCITTDNASNNGKMMKHLSKMLEEEKGIIWDPAEHHITCLSHVINLIVTDFMKAIKGFKQEKENSDDEKESDNEEKGFLKTMSKL